MTYPFTTLGGVKVDKQVSGQRVYDINKDGVAHYGLYPDWIQDLKMQAGQDIVKDMSRGPEAYLQMWERAYGVKPNACTNPASKLSPATITVAGQAPAFTSWQTLTRGRPARPSARRQLQLLHHRRQRARCQFSSAGKVTKVVGLLSRRAAAVSAVTRR